MLVHKRARSCGKDKAEEGARRSNQQDLGTETGEEEGGGWGGRGREREAAREERRVPSNAREHTHQPTLLRQTPMAQAGWQEAEGAQRWAGMGGMEKQYIHERKA